MQDELAAKLTKSSEELGVKLSSEATMKLLTYMQLLEKWNHVYNLTAVRSPEEMMVKHVLDSLAVVPHVFGKTLLDVGSGAGIPGIILALVVPDLRVRLLDASGKKCTFLQQVIIELGIANAKVENTRVEDLQIDEQFEMVICRAFSSIEKFVTLCGRFLSPEGALVAMKAKVDAHELAAVPSGFIINKQIELRVPDLDASRQLVFISKGGACV